MGAAALLGVAGVLAFDEPGSCDRPAAAYSQSISSRVPVWASSGGVLTWTCWEDVTYMASSEVWSRRTSRAAAYRRDSPGVTWCVFFVPLMTFGKDEKGRRG